jgi:hypothetical protein
MPLNARGFDLEWFSLDICQQAVAGELRGRTSWPLALVNFSTQLM